MKAKLEARNTGTWRPVISWNSSVPSPAVNSATFGSSPVMSGISTKAPKATNSICAPDNTWRQSGSLNSSCIVGSSSLGAGKQFVGTGVEDDIARQLPTQAFTYAERADRRISAKASNIIINPRKSW